MSTLTGILVQKGKINLDDQAPIEEWTQDDRSQITWNHILQMTYGLDWVENYASMSDVTTMLYTSDDIYSFAIDHELSNSPGETFNYSSGTSNILKGIGKVTESRDTIRFQTLLIQSMPVHAVPSKQKTSSAPTDHKVSSAELSRLHDDDASSPKSTCVKTPSSSVQRPNAVARYSFPWNQ